MLLCLTDGLMAGFLHRRGHQSISTDHRGSLAPSLVLLAGWSFMSDCHHASLPS